MNKHTKRPNILFLMTDEQRFDTFSHINDEIKTPHLDALIKESVFFQNAYCSNPSCIPSRAAIVTGKFPTQCQCPTYISRLPENERTFMTMLQEAGYYTSVIGKQHFASSKISRGYHEESIIDGHGPLGDPEEVALYTEYLANEGIDLHSLYKDGLIIGGEWVGHEKYHIDYYIGELGKKWISAYDREESWFLTLSFPGPHQPYDCEGTSYAEGYELDKLSMPETTYEMLDQKPPHYKSMKDQVYLKNHSQETYKKTKRSYYANMTLIDEKIGQVIKMLKEKGLYDNTLIIYSTDHGDFMGDFGCVTKAQYLNQGLMRVPLLVKPPIEGFSGIEVKEDVLNIDIAATCLGVAGRKVEKDMSDFGYLGYWDDNIPLKIRDYIFMEASNIKAVIKDGMKLIHYMDRPYGELYDLNTDPLEKNNLWEDESYTKAKLTLSRIIIDHMIKMTPKWDMEWNYNAPKI